MAHYAFLNENNVVTEVITGKDETELIEKLEPEIWYGNFRGQKCVRTSYNNKIRYNYAGVGYTFDPDADAFISPRPECGHKELFLNDVYKWNCQGCDLEQKRLIDEAKTI
jgi:hypothetical protein